MSGGGEISWTHMKKLAEAYDQQQKEQKMRGPPAAGNCDGPDLSMYFGNADHGGAGERSKPVVAPNQRTTATYYSNGRGRRNTSWSPKKEDHRRSRCMWCGREGHLDQNCWVKKGACLICGSMDHFAKACPQSRSQERQQEFKCPTCSGPHLGVKCPAGKKSTLPPKDQALS